MGSDIAVDAADIALVNDDIRELPHLLGLSKRMMRTIKINLAVSMTLNFVAIAFGRFRGAEPGDGGAGPQRGQRGGHHQLGAAAQMAQPGPGISKPGALAGSGAGGGAGARSAPPPPPGPPGSPPAQD